MRRRVTEPRLPTGGNPLPNLAAHTTIASIMTRQVVSVRHDASIESVTALFVERGLHGAPVVDDRGDLIGFISLADLVRDRYDNGDTQEQVPLRVHTRNGGSYELGDGFHAEGMAPVTVADLMMPFAISLDESTPITMAAALMATEHVHRVPVIARDGRVAGILSSLDVLRWLAKADGYLVPEHAPPPRHRTPAA